MRKQSDATNDSPILIKLANIFNMHHLNSLDSVKDIFYKNTPMQTTEGHLLLDSLAQSHFLGSVVWLRVLNTLGT